MKRNEVLLRNSSGWQQTGWAGRRPHGKSIMVEGEKKKKKHRGNVNPDVTITKTVAVFQRGPTCGTFSQLESEVISGTRIWGGGRGSNWQQTKRRKKTFGQEMIFKEFRPSWYFYTCPTFRGESQQVWHLSIFKSKQLKDRRPHIPEMTPCHSEILLRPNCELWRAASTVMDIDHPEEFFEAWQLWFRFSQGSINCTWQNCEAAIWGGVFYTGTLLAGTHHLDTTAAWLTCFHLHLFCPSPVILECPQSLHGL